MSQDITAGELIAMLSEYGEDTPVRVAHQPSYPMQLHLSRELAYRTSGDWRQYLYLLAGDQPSDAPYAPSGIFEGQLEDEAESPCPHNNVARPTAERPYYRCNDCGEDV